MVRRPGNVWADTDSGVMASRLTQATTAATGRTDNRVMTAAFNEDADRKRALPYQQNHLSERVVVFGISVDKFVWSEFEECAVLDAHAQGIDVGGAFTLRLVHQLIGTGEQFMGQGAGDVPPLVYVAEQQAD